MQKTKTAFPWIIALAAALNGFAIIMVNYWIYNARWWFIAERGDHNGLPPTISRAISIDAIGDPFAFWITISGICLVFGLALLGFYYWQMRVFFRPPDKGLRIGMWVILPSLLIFQIAAGVGMNFLSVYRFPNFHEMHMVGSYMFFISQAIVVLLYTLWNRILLRDPDNLVRLEMAGLLSQRWVRRRYALGVFSIAFTVIYFSLFFAKSFVVHESAPWIYYAYVTAEPMMISTMLFVLLLAHMDKFRRSSVHV